VSQKDSETKALNSTDWPEADNKKKKLVARAQEDHLLLQAQPVTPVRVELSSFHSKYRGISNICSGTSTTTFMNLLAQA
jgi:hypothetical protein